MILALLGRYWLHLLAAAVLAAAVWTVNGWRVDAAKVPELERTAKQYRQALQTAAAKADSDRRADAANAARLNVDLAFARAETTLLRLSWERVPAYIEVPAHAPDQPATRRLSALWGVCFSAAAGGDPADVAACKAARVPDAR